MGGGGGGVNRPPGKLKGLRGRCCASKKEEKISENAIELTLKREKGLIKRVERK